MSKRFVALKMDISSFPVSAEMVSSQIALQGKLISAIGEAGLRIEIAAQPDAAKPDNARRGRG
ncbi:hypothetical protein ABIF90_008144 [Bradyrhizobium japonicum]